MKKLMLILSLSLLCACTPSSDTSDIIEKQMQDEAILNINPDELVEYSIHEGEVIEEFDFDFGETDANIDLTSLSATMVYAQVSDLMTKPDGYIGQTIRAYGTFESYPLEGTDEDIYFIVINDAVGCCPQGLEIVLPEGVTPPENYSNILIEGEFQTGIYQEMKYIFIDTYSFDII